MTGRTSRRDFIKQSSLLVVGGSLTLARAAHAFGSDVIRVGLVGCGKCGSRAVLNALSTTKSGAGGAEGPLRLVALADVFGDQLQKCYRAVNGLWASSVELSRDRRFLGLDAYRGLLDCDLDLVVLASPPAFRPLHFEAAVRAGKHVFMEMPIATDVPGVRRVLEANERAKARGLSVAVGLPRRHEKRYQETIRRLHDGAIGQVVLARAYWNAGPVAAHTRQAKDTELSDQLRNWRRFPWLSGDLVVEQHVQNLDVIHWLKGDVPLECNGIATRDNHLAPDPRLACEQHFVEYAFADGSRLFSQCRRKDHCWNVVSEYAHGTKGYANISSGRICDRAGTPIWSFGSGESRGAQEQQFQLMTALRRGELLNEVDHASKSTLMAILGRTATYTGRVERWSDLLNSSLPMADVDRLCGGDTAVM